jgi:hypothetical protein
VSGYSGYTGASGISGYSGYTGDSGISGYSGYSGASGISGYSGYSGISGYSGNSGISGYSGYTGVSGYSGFSGKSGYSGYSGESGYSGYTGESGYSGYTGVSGYSGYTGISGYSGYSGTSGYSGFSGISGYTGESGLSGYSGFSGGSGYSGFSGESGYSGFSGESGYSGYSGISGYSGYTGISGYSGYTGASGISGYSGYTGASGISGYSGYTGASGLSGYSGYTGASGESGYSGFSGVSGYSGYSGFSGESGYSGYTGTSGYSGYTGLSGYSGYSGISGYSGYTGVSGYSGYTGISGYSGSGVSGYSGYSGTSGYSGASGYSGYSGENLTVSGTSGYLPRFYTDDTLGDSALRTGQSWNDEHGYAYAPADIVVDGPGASGSFVSGSFGARRLTDQTGFWYFADFGWDNEALPPYMTFGDGGANVMLLGQYATIASSATHVTLTSTQDIFNRLGDASGVRKIYIQNSSTQDVASIDSSGSASFKDLILTVPSDTPPITVTSTVLCPNLNADLLDGHHWAEITTMSGYSGYTGVSGTSGYTGVSGKSGYTGASGISGFSGTSGLSGYSGYQGNKAGALYYFDTTTAEGTGGDGCVRFNAPTTSATTEIYIDDADVNGLNFAAWAANIGSNSHLYISVNDAAQAYVAVFSVTGNSYEASSYFKLIVTKIAGAVSSIPDNSQRINLWYIDKGTAGASGYSGVSGFTGASGISGYSGLSGVSGQSGYSGFTGVSGVSGYSGISGFTGASGKSGYSGYSGLSGYSGYCGLSGHSGYSGSGVSGYSGYSGSGVTDHGALTGLSDDDHPQYQKESEKDEASGYVGLDEDKKIAVGDEATTTAQANVRAKTYATVGLAIKGKTEPTDIKEPDEVFGTNLKGWYKAENITGKSDGDALTQWDDLSGNGYHMTVPSGKTGAQYYSNTLNGKAVTRWTTGDGMANSSFPHGNDLAIFMVFKRAGNYSRWDRHIQGVGGKNWWVGLRDDENNGSKKITVNLDGGSIGYISGYNTQDQYYLVSVRRSSTQAILARRNSESDTATGLTGKDMGTGMAISGGGTYAEYVYGDIAEIIYADCLPTATQMADINNYVLSEYGITGMSEQEGSSSGLTQTADFIQAINNDGTVLTGIDKNGSMKFKSGSNMRLGQATLLSGTVTVNNTTITANTMIFMQRVSGSNEGHLEYSITAGTSFTITSTNTWDDGVINWLLVESM